MNQFVRELKLPASVEARVTPLCLRVRAVAMLYSAEQYQTILDEHRNGISLAKGVIAGLVAASLAMELEPDQVLTCLKDKELLDGMLEAVDEEGDSVIDESIRRNIKAHKAILARWVKDVKDPTHRDPVSSKGRKVAEEEDTEDMRSVVESSDSEEESAR